MSRLPEPTRSEAVLIGCGDYRRTELSRIPAITNNLQDLAAILTELSGFRECTVIADPVSAREVTTPLRDAANQATDVLLLYYAGHGFVDMRGELYLGVAIRYRKSWPYRPYPSRP